MKESYQLFDSCAERKRGPHLGPEERGTIEALKKQGFGAGAISRAIGCAPSTVTNELERGTPPRRSSKGKAPGYSPKRGEAVYKAHRVNSCKPRKAESCKPFIARVVKQVREHKWSLDACCGYAKRQFLFNEQNCRIKQICSLPKDNLQPAYPRRHRELSRFLFKCTQIYS